jgi:peptidylprolyl isomerase
MYFPSRLARRASVALALLVSAAACGSDSTTQPSGPSDPATETYATALGVNISQMTKKSADLYIQDIVVGTGTEVAANGRIVRVTYTGWLANGTQFDSNVGGATLTFTVGGSDPFNVIDGWDQGIAGMRVGGKRRLVIGSNLGYGPAGNPPKIPANATLVFDVELVSIV